MRFGGFLENGLVRSLIRILFSAYLQQRVRLGLEVVVQLLLVRLLEQPLGL